MMIIGQTYFKNPVLFTPQVFLKNVWSFFIVIYGLQTVTHISDSAAFEIWFPADWQGEGEWQIFFNDDVLSNFSVFALLKLICDCG